MKTHRRILYISGALNFGAPGKIVEQIGLLAIENGYDVLVAHSSRNANPSQLQTLSVTSKLQERIHALGALLFDLHGLLSVRQTKNLINQIKEYKPDIIHLHNIHGYFVNFKILFEYLVTLDIPIIWTLHDCWPFTGRCFHFEGIGCDKWQTECNNCKAPKGYTVSPFCDRSNELYKLKRHLFASVKNLTLIPVSRWLSDFIPQSFLKGCRTKVIENGVDLDIFSPQQADRLRRKHNLTGKFVILGVAAPWNKRKGLQDFLKLRQLLPEHFAIILVGLSKKQVESLPSDIIGITRTESQHELAEYYSLADIFCNLTYLDTFPTVNLEALACGTPILTYKTGGSPEALDHTTGIVVPQGDITAVADTIKALDRNYYFERNACRKRAELHYNQHSQFNKYIELYHQLLNPNT